MKKMKKVLHGSLFGIMFLIVLLHSCTKEDVIDIENGLNAKAATSDQAISADIPNMAISACCIDDRTLWDISKQEYCCKQGGNCLPCIIVSSEYQLPQQVVDMNSLIGKAGNFVAEFFSNEKNYENLFPALLKKEEMDFLYLLRSGKYIITGVYASSCGNVRVYNARNIENEENIGLPCCVYSSKP